MEVMANEAVMTSRAVNDKVQRQMKEFDQKLELVRVEVKAVKVVVEGKIDIHDCEAAIERALLRKADVQLLDEKADKVGAVAVRCPSRCMSGARTLR